MPPPAADSTVPPAPTSPPSVLRAPSAAPPAKPSRLQTTLTTLPRTRSPASHAHCSPKLSTVFAAWFRLIAQVATPVSIALSLLCFVIKAVPAHALKPALLATFAAMHLKCQTPPAPLLKVTTLRVLLVTVNHFAAILHRSAPVVPTGPLHQT